MRKRVILIFNAGKRIRSHVPPVVLDWVALNVVHRFKHLGYTVIGNLGDNEAIERKRGVLTLIRNIIALNYKYQIYRALQVQYNNVFRMVLRLPR